MGAGPRFESIIALHAAGDTVRRDVTFWGKVMRAFGSKTELASEQVHTHLTTAHLVGATKVVLQRLGVHNAVSLVIDGHVLFEDRAGRDDDFNELFLAFYANEGRYGRDFHGLFLSFEHLAAGMHLSIVVDRARRARSWRGDRAGDGLGRPRRAAAIARGRVGAASSLRGVRCAHA